jgi:hypothetical protein
MRHMLPHRPNATLCWRRNIYTPYQVIFQRGADSPPQYMIEDSKQGGIVSGSKNAFRMVYGLYTIYSGLLTRFGHFWKRVGFIMQPPAHGP